VDGVVHRLVQSVVMVEVGEWSTCFPDWLCVLEWLCLSLDLGTDMLVKLNCLAWPHPVTALLSPDEAVSYLPARVLPCILRIEEIVHVFNLCL